MPDCFQPTCSQRIWAYLRDLFSYGFRLTTLAVGVIALPLLAASASNNTSPRFPTGFARSGDVYEAQRFGSAIQVSRDGATINTPSSHLRFHALHANPNSRLSAEEGAGQLSEMVGSDRTKWRIGVPLFARVRDAEVYPGIELDWHAESRDLEYDFLIAPHADPARIQLQIDGAGAIVLNDRGDLNIATQDGNWIQHKPIAFQLVKGARQEVASRAVRNGNTIRFELGAYDTSLPVTIDPALSYSTYLGGIATDEGHAIGIDGLGNTFVAGSTYSTTHSNSNVFLEAVSSSGVPTVVVYGGAEGNDTANAIAVDAAGNFFIAGSTTSIDFPVTNSLAIQSSEFGLQKAFAIGFEAGVSAPVWSAFFGGSASDEALGIALGPNNLLYIVGDTDSKDFLNYSLDGSLITTNAFQYSNHGGFDGFLVSIATSGVFRFATYIGGSGDDYANAVVVDANSSIYVVGSTSSTDFGVFKAFQPKLASGVDAFAVALGFNASTANSYGFWSTYIGGASDDVASAVALDASSNVYIAGTTGSTDFPVSDFAYQKTYGGGASDGFVFVLDNAAPDAIWSSYLGTSTADALNAIALNASGDIFLTGTTDSVVFPVTADAVQSQNGGGQDVIVSELNNTGTSLLFSTYLGGSGNDIGRGIAVDTAGNIYVDGITASSNNDFPVTTGTYHAAYAGGSSDAFLSILGCSGAVPAVAAGGVTNGASFLATTVSPGGLISIFGTDFACSAAGASAVPLGVSLSGASVAVNGIKIPLLYAGATQINAQLPYEIPAGSATLTITNAYGTSAAAAFTVVPAGPGIFMAGTQAAALNYPSYTINSTTNGAAPGSTVIVYLTGLGSVAPAIVDGAAAPSAPFSYPTATPVSATINGQPVTVNFLGIAPGFVGLGQANLLVPPGLAGGTYPVVITIGALSSQPANVTVSN